MNYIRKWREHYELTQDDLARKSGVSIHTINRYENGRNTKLELLELLAGAIGVEVTQLLICDPTQDIHESHEMQDSKESQISQELPDSHEQQDSGDKVNKYLKKEELEEYIKTIPEEVINQVTQDYDDGIKVKEIIAKNNLKLAVGQLSRILPPIEVDTKCPYCNLNMVINRRRTGMFNDPYCTICGHKKSSFGFCRCNNCQEAKRKELEAKQLSASELIRKSIPEAKKDYSELEPEEQLRIISLLKDSTVYDYDEFEKIYSKNIHSGNLYRILALFHMRLISVSDNTSYRYIIEDSDGFLFNPSDVNYVFNVNFTDYDRMMVKKGYIDFSSLSEEEVKQITIDLYYYFLLENIQKGAEQRGMSFSPTDKQLTELKGLIEKWSYTQILYLTYKVFRFYSDQIIKRRMTKTSVAKCILASIKNFGDKNISDYGNIYKCSPEYADPFILFYVRSILGEDIDILNKPVKDYLFENRHQYE